MSPDLSSAILKALNQIKESLATGNITQANELQQLLLSLEDKVPPEAFVNVRAELHKMMGQSVRIAANELPINAKASAMFDVLNPNHLTAVRDLDTQVIKGLRDEVKDVIRAHVENGLRDGTGPRTIARGIRDVVGLSPSQLQAVENFKRALEEGDVSKALGYKLRDKRLKVSKEMSSEQIEKATSAYRKRFIAHHADTISRTATLDSLKKGQALAWEQAVDSGAVDPQRLTKTWVQVDRPTKRESHVSLNGETVPYNVPYSNGEMVPGSTTYNCACISRYSTQKQIGAASPPNAAPAFAPTVEEGFTPASTIKEAEDWARANIAKEVDYSKMDVESANMLNKTWGDLQKQYPEVTIGYIGPYSKTRRMMGFTVKRGSEDKNVFELINVGDKQALAYSTTNTGTMSKLSQTMDKLRESGTVRNMRSPEEFITHEFAHAIDNARSPGIIARTPSDKLMQAWHEQFKADGFYDAGREGRTARRMAETTGTYINSNKQEFFAEAFRMYKHNSLPPELEWAKAFFKGMGL
jgi:hypothetical protein